MLSYHLSCDDPDANSAASAVDMLDLLREFMERAGARISDYEVVVDCAFNR